MSSSRKTFRSMPTGPQRQAGVALVVAMIFLLVVTVIGVVAADNSRQGLNMTGNMQDNYDSFQSAEAGALAVIATAGTANDVFRDVDGYEEGVLSGLASDAHPLNHLSDGESKTTINVRQLAELADCPRSSTNDTSVGLLACHYYRVESEHDVENKSRTLVTHGVVKTVKR